MLGLYAHFASFEDSKAWLIKWYISDNAFWLIRAKNKTIIDQPYQDLGSDNTTQEVIDAVIANLNDCLAIIYLNCRHQITF